MQNDDARRHFPLLLTDGKLAMKRSLAALVMLFALAPLPAAGQEAQSARKMTSQELAEWIDRRFGEEYEKQGVKPAEAVDDETFLRRVHLDLQGRIPTVAQLRDFADEAGSFKRQDRVDLLLSDDRRPERFAQRTSMHLARVWRRMMIPAGAPGAAMGPQLDPWLARQFEANTPYDEFARKLLLARPLPQPALGVTPPPMDAADPDAQAVLFQQAVGLLPENLAGAYVRVFLGVRLNCAQCHDHPFTDWKQRDFWGIAAFFGAAPPAEGEPMPESMPVPQITPIDGDGQTFTAKLLWSDQPLEAIPAGKSPRELLADWLVAPENPNFAATAVNRVWQYLCGRGLAGPVEELDQASPEERRVLDELAQLFIESGHDVQWLIAGICKSRVYQQSLPAEPAADGGSFVHRPLKTLLPEQVFDSLEQALSLPIGKADMGPRWSGEREQFVARMNEAAPDSPVDYKGGIPQALMLMNGKLTADATSLDNSRTLRAVVEAPFLKAEEKIEVLYLAVLSRKPKPAEAEFLLAHVRGQADEEQQKLAYARIMWGLLNSPEFVLSR